MSRAETKRLRIHYPKQNTRPLLDVIGYVERGVKIELSETVHGAWDREESAYIYLTIEDAVRLRDHLNDCLAMRMKD